MWGQTRARLVIVVRVEAGAVVGERPVTMGAPGGQAGHIAGHVGGVHRQGETVIAVHSA